MANLMYLKGMELLNAAFSSMDVRAILVMSDTTADTENVGKNVVADFTTLDESDATGYARQAMGSEAVNVDTSNVRIELDGNDLVFSGLGGDATRDYVGVVLVKNITNDSDSPPLSFIGFTSPIPKTATQVTVPWDAQGIIQVSQAA